MTSSTKASQEQGALLCSSSIISSGYELLSEFLKKTRKEKPVSADSRFNGLSRFA